MIISLFFGGEWIMCCVDSACDTFTLDYMVASCLRTAENRVRYLGANLFDLIEKHSALSIGN